MYQLFTGKDKDGFVYVDISKDNLKALGDIYKDYKGNELRVIEFANFKVHQEFVREMLKWNKEALRINLAKDPKFLPRNKRN